MEEMLYLILAALGLIATTAGVGGYIRSRKKSLQKRSSLPPEKPSAGEVVSPVPDIAPTPSETSALDRKAAETDNDVAEVDEQEAAIEKELPSENQPDANVVDFLRRQRDESD